MHDATAGDANMSKPYRIIIVDDELISRGFMEMLIKPLVGYEIAAALPYAKDVMLWCGEHQPPDLIIRLQLHPPAKGFCVYAKIAWTRCFYLY